MTNLAQKLNRIRLLADGSSYTRFSWRVQRNGSRGNIVYYYLTCFVSSQSLSEFEFKKIGNGYLSHGLHGCVGSFVERVLVNNGHAWKLKDLIFELIASCDYQLSVPHPS